MLTVTVWIPFSLSFAMSDADTPATIKDAQSIPNLGRLTVGLDAINFDNYKHVLGIVNVGQSISRWLACLFADINIASD